MKRTSIIIRIFVWTLMLLLGIYALNKIIMPKWLYVINQSGGPMDRYESFYRLDTNSLDYAVLGPSHSFYSVNPMQIYAETGIRGYNLGGPAQTIGQSYFWLRELCRTQKPKVILLDVGGLLYYKSEHSSDLKNLIYMKNSPLKWEAAYKCKGENQSMLSFLFPIYEFHDRWKDLDEDDFVVPQYYFLKGSYLDFRISANIKKDAINDRVEQRYTILKNGDIQTEKVGIPQILDANKQWFEKMLSFCEQNDIELIPVKFPTKNWDSDKSNTVKMYLETLGLDLLELQAESSIGIDWDMDSNDDGYHVNYYGATKLSGWLGNFLKDRISIEPFGDENLDFWNRDMAEYAQWEQDEKIDDVLKTYDYFNTLNLNKDKSIIVIAVKDEASGSWNPILESQFRLLGLKEKALENIQNSFIAIIDEGNVILETWEENKISAQFEFVDESGKSHGVKAVSGGYAYGNLSSILVDKEEYSLNVRGLDIIVIDKKNGMVVSSVGIDTHIPQYSFKEKEMNGKAVETWNTQYANSQVLSDGEYYIYPSGTQAYRWDIAGGSEEEEANLGLWEINDGAHQRFFLKHMGNGLYTICSSSSEKYVSVFKGGMREGTNVVQCDYTGLAQQKWFFVPNIDGTFTIYSFYNGLPLDIAGGRPGLGVNIQVWNNLYTNGQHFAFQKIK